MHLDLTLGHFSRISSQMHKLTVGINRDYHRFRLFGAPHDPEDLESDCLVPADI
jgi:hypothetical protein